MKEVLHIGSEIPVYSIIVFSERCALKNITVTAKNTFVVKRNDLSRTVITIIQNNNISTIQQYMDKYYEILFPFSQVTEAVKNQHIENIRSEIMEQPVQQPVVSAEPVNRNVEKNKAGAIVCSDRFCPLCGSAICMAEKADKIIYMCQNAKCDYRFVSNKSN